MHGLGVHVKEHLGTCPPPLGPRFSGFCAQRGEASWASRLLRKKPVAAAVVGWGPS